ncbi:allophanate hydrolase subunit 1 [Staphylococcus simiae]|uniref:5-oxoprolinase subunit B family protein n=1 Tax=Staphylococcus simiae TaxID=308354 RepID=UPI001A96A459|nr:allophanate hydrolase subunit 1 [Staphylococcus simiae]MBO1198799.1 allophanate hydrolase subunit 1 [Staphylococcus simiae]MBO1200746.1 allophanate hydrolase subunit 1 [Staphylococcus simiae]MBO1203259.1 allophanate hydrolase subunit 1 [Staphylococcus simiae]MBO1210570.1 allophanate hydrolase subunit 1 [Staphylococcus simiae]MBO1229082.1 allophanate hydrolase subunit 1 [Staphylococcus simiae]
MKIYSQGDQAIVIAIEKEVSKSLTEDLLTLRDYLVKQNYPFITEIVPTESDMMICYDARDMIKHHNIQSPFLYMKALVESIHLDIKHDFNSQSDIEIPVIYGSTYGPDLTQLLKEYNMSLDTFINLHTNSQYFVSMMGYSPGFPYLTGMNKKLFVNHTSNRKKFIPAGSVVIEGKKCGIVTTDTYNDWLVIGFTPLTLFNPNNDDFALLKLGDNVKFKQIKENEIELGAFDHVNHNRK